MIYNSAKRAILLVSILGCAAIAAALTAVWAANEQPTEVNQTYTKAEPIIIWFHNGATDPPEALATALSSGLINHVMILYMHRADADWRTNQKVVNAIDIVKKSGAKLIWSRTLWPTYNNKEIRPEILFDPNYYIREIQSLRSEAAQMGADFVALDTEAYAGPMQAYMKKQITLKTSEIQRVNSVIKKVINETGKVDFVYPEGWPGNAMPYDSLAELGICRIAECTYYADYEAIKRLKTPYDIFGAYVNTAKLDPNNPKAPYFTVKQIFDESGIWSSKKGLFIYPKEGKSLEVARQLVAYAKSRTRVNKVSERDIEKIVQEPTSALFCRDKN